MERDRQNRVIQQRPLQKYPAIDDQASNDGGRRSPQIAILWQNTSLISDVAFF
jgi:hypothetical protein